MGFFEHSFCLLPANPWAGNRCFGHGLFPVGKWPCPRKVKAGLNPYFHFVIVFLYRFFY